MIKKVVIIVLLIVLLVIVGILIHTNIDSNKVADTTVADTTNTTTPATNTTVPSKTNTANPVVTPPARPDNSQIIAALATAQNSNVEAYVKKVDAASDISNIVSITDCKATPDVIKVAMGGSLTLKNGNSLPHIISYPVNGIILDKGQAVGGKITVPAKGQVQVIFNNVVRGIYGFACDPDTRTGADIGLFYVTK